MKSIPMYQSIANQLRNDIKLKNPGDQLPPEPKLAEMFGTTSLTIRNSLAVLAKEGLVDRIHGKGTFVALPVKNARANSILYIGMNQGHLYQNLFNEVTKMLHSHGFSVSVFNSDVKLPLREKEELFASMLNCKPKAIVSASDLKILDHFRTQLEFVLPPVYQILFKGDVPRFECNEILSDHVAGGYRIAEHLYSLGRKKILFAAPDYVSETAYSWRLLDGARNFSSQHKDLELIFIGQKQKDFHTMIDDIAKEVKCQNITGLITYMDYMARLLVEKLNSSGMKVPEAVAVCGYNNTPWAYQRDFPLTTVDLKVDEIVRVLGEALNSHELKLRTWYIQPELILQESTIGQVLQMKEKPREFLKNDFEMVI